MGLLLAKVMSKCEQQGASEHEAGLSLWPLGAGGAVYRSRSIDAVSAKHRKPLTDNMS